MEGTFVSNGLGWTADGEVMFFADSRGPWIDRWRFDRWTGTMSERTRFADLDEATGRPDGGSCDAESFYWSAGVSAGRLNRFAPDGTLVQAYDVPAPAPTMPCFGGPGFATLFLTSLREGRAGRGARTRAARRRAARSAGPRGRLRRLALPGRLTMADAAFLARCIAAGAGREPADLVIGDVELLDVMTGALTRTDVAIVGDRIVGTHARYEGRRASTGRGLTCVPGFIDTHLHVESSLVTPLEFDRCVLRHGVTTAICDPHEIANVLGLDGIRYFLAAAERTVMDLRVNLSSCVPATAFETSGAALSAADLVTLRGHPKVIGLAEFMNFPGVVACDPGCDRKARRVPGRAYRRPRAAPLRPRPERLSRRPHPHGPRGDERGGGARKARQGHDRADPRRLGVEGHARSRRGARRATPPPSWRSAPTTAIRSTSPRRATSIT